jgi:hypothetical protein
MFRYQDADAKHDMTAGSECCEYDENDDMNLKFAGMPSAACGLGR